MTAVGATVVVGADRTAMNPDAVTDTLAEEDVYDAFATEMIAQFEPGENESDSAADFAGSGAPAIDEVAESVVTEEYVRTELEGAVDAFYAYLHGDRDDLALTVDMAPVRDGFRTEYGEWVRDADVADLEPDAGVEGVDYAMADLAENRSQFQATRQSFKEDQLQRIQERTPRERTRAELEEIYGDNRDRIRQEMVSQLESGVAAEGTPEALRPATVAYGTVGVDALVAEETSFETFQAEERAAREDLAAAVESFVGERISAEVPQTLDMTAEMDDSARESLDQARTAVSAASILVFALPAIGLIAAGFIVYVSRRRSNGLWRVGIPVAAAGLLGYVGADLVGGTLTAQLAAEGADSSAVGRAMLGIIGDTLGAIGAQSLVLVAVGLAFVAAGVVVRRGLVPLADEPA